GPRLLLCSAGATPTRSQTPVESERYALSTDVPSAAPPLLSPYEGSLERHRAPAPSPDRRWPPDIPLRCWWHGQSAEKLSGPLDPRRRRLPRLLRLGRDCLWKRRRHKRPLDLGHLASGLEHHL